MKRLVSICLCLSALAYSLAYSQVKPLALDYTLLMQMGHNPKNFTQGLILNRDMIIETSGLYNQSFITEYNIDTGVETKRISFPDSIFAEGLTLFQNQLFILSWKAQTVFILNPSNFDLIKTLSYHGEGWGITHNDSHLITSDGTQNITFRDANDFSIKRSIQVHSDTRQYNNINELEYAHDLIWANVWQSPNILAIDPQTGEVVAILNLEKLVEKNHTIPQTSVLNGIAYDKNRNAFWVTGKLWPTRYLIQPIWSKLVRQKTPVEKENKK